MQNQKKDLSQHFFLFSFLPTLGYWYLEEYYPVRIAVAGGIVLAILEIVLEKIFTKHVHTLSRFNFFLVFFLGLISILGEKGVWFKLQPFFSGVVLFSYLAWELKKGKGLVLEMMAMRPNMQGAFENPILKESFIRFEWHMAFYLLFYGIFMAILALFASTNIWAFFKTIGFYLVSFLFMILEILLIRKKLRNSVAPPK